MALTSEVKHFFINRINSVLDKRVKEVKETFDDDQIKEDSLALFLDHVGITDIFARYLKSIEELAAARKSHEDLEKLIQISVTESGEGRMNGYYSGSCDEKVQSLASEKYHDQLMAERYPEVSERLKELSEMKLDVEGAVLLSTTEPRLRATLVNLVEKYGGDLSSITNLLQ